MTPVRLAAQLSISDKTLRRFLRRRFPRHRGDHGSAWFLTDEQVAVARQHFGRGGQRSATTVRSVALAPRIAKATARPAVANSPPLRCYFRPGLNVLFVALNPPPQSAGNKHWFS